MIHERNDFVNRLEVKGIGELRLLGTAAAVAPAIHFATGKRLRALPFTLRDI
jgi:xanthine dehydrogenase YagR molybdenum-binding subunit